MSATVFFKDIVTVKQENTSNQTTCFELGNISKEWKVHKPNREELSMELTNSNKNSQLNKHASMRCGVVMVHHTFFLSFNWIEKWSSSHGYALEVFCSKIMTELIVCRLSMGRNRETNKQTWILGDFHVSSHFFLTGVFLELISAETTI